MSKRSLDRAPPSRVASPRIAATTRRGRASTAPHVVPKAPPRIAFLGLGAMGAPMATRLVAHGYPVHVYNRTRGRDRALTREGAVSCATGRACATNADIVFTMLSDAEALATVLEGEDGVLAALSAHRGKHRPIVVDMSTIGRAAAIAAGKRVESHGGRFVDAPVSGSVGPASRGELVALVGGGVRAVERVRPVLNVFCKKIIHAGPVGYGQALKIVLNGIGAHHFVALASMMALGERAGLARDVLLEAFTTGAFATPSYAGKRDKLLARDFTPEFSLALALKDCTLNVALQDECGLTLPVHRRIVEEVDAAVRKGLGDLDLFAIEKRYAR